MDAKPLPAWPTWCPQCGPHVLVDSDGTCRSCGADAMGEGADAALRALDDLASLRARIAAAVARCNELHKAHDRTRCGDPYADGYDVGIRQAAEEIRAKLSGT